MSKRPPAFVQYELVPYKHPCHVQGCTEKPAPYVPIIEVRDQITGGILVEYQMPQYVCDRCRRLLPKHVILTPEVVRWVSAQVKNTYNVERGYKHMGVRYETISGLRPVDAPLILPACGRKLE